MPKPERSKAFEHLLSARAFLTEGNLKGTSATVARFLRSRYKKIRNKEAQKINYFLDEKESLFSIRYEKVQDDHLVNYIIESKLQNGKEIRLIVDGPLCPFATTGIIMIASGAYALDFDR